MMTQKTRQNHSLSRRNFLKQAIGLAGLSCFDSTGNIVAAAGWETRGSGNMIYVLAPNGRVLETHPTPLRAANCTFGDTALPPGRWLFAKTR